MIDIRRFTYAELKLISTLLIDPAKKHTTNA
jgi:hypothetical protein